MKAVEMALKGMEKVAKTAAEVKGKVLNLDKPLQAENLEGMSSRAKENLLDKLDKPLSEDIIEYDKDGFRTLTEEEKQELRENMDWPDKPEGIQGCRINEDGVIKYPCRNDELAGQKHPDTGVEYEKRIVEINGYQVECVSPIFPAEFSTELPQNLWKETDREQFKFCNGKLYERIKEDPELVGKFSPDQLRQIEEGITSGKAPENYLWHHDVKVGVMQLVDKDLHEDSRHTGGRTLWGGGKAKRQ